MYSINNNLESCNIGDSGAELLGNMKWPNLKYLDIGKIVLNSGYNNITG